MKQSNSEALFVEAKKYFPGGVNSPVRAFKSVGGNPVFFERGKGSHVWDLDGREFLDMSIMAVGACILGYADEEVDELLFADALAELGDLGGSSLRGWGGDEVSARALFSNDLTVLLNFGRLCSQAGAWPQAVRAFERAVPLLRATDDAAGLAEVEQQLDAARQQLPQ
jgi:hypothetical protein